MTLSGQLAFSSRGWCYCYLMLRYDVDFTQHLVCPVNTVGSFQLKMLTTVFYLMLMLVLRSLSPFPTCTFIVSVKEGKFFMFNLAYNSTVSFLYGTPLNWICVIGCPSLTVEGSRSCVWVMTCKNAYSIFMYTTVIFSQILEKVTQMCHFLCLCTGKHSLWSTFFPHFLKTDFDILFQAHCYMYNILSLTPSPCVYSSSCGLQSLYRFGKKRKIHEELNR